MELNKKIVLVTGGGSGIGLELSRQLAALGNTVFICGRNEEKLLSAVRDTDLRPIVADVTRAEDQNRVLQMVGATAGRLDLLVNNAAVLFAYDFAGATDTIDRIETEIDINAKAPLTLTKRALPLMAAGEDPAVLFIGSAAAYVPVAGTPVYSGTKALIHHAVQSLRHQLKPSGIDVYEVLPPVIDTDMGNALKSENLKVMQPRELVSGILDGLKQGQLEMTPGQAKQLKWMSRVAPQYMIRQMAKTRFH